VSDIGLVRQQNQDAFVVTSSGPGVVAVVCDGVASSVDGRAAADRGAEVAAAALATAIGDGSWDAAGAMADAVGRARAAVAALGENVEGGRSPSCTLVAAVWDGTTLTLASIGDSRAYWLAPGSSRVLTVDDSWVQEQVHAGAMSESTAMGMPLAHGINNWLGADAPDLPSELTAFVPPGPGHVVLCSDGLWNHIPQPSALEALVTGSGDTTPFVLASRLADAALDAGGRDNVTVVVMEVRP